MTFTELSTLVKGKRLPNYYMLILTHSDIIIQEVGLTDKQTVAGGLNLSPQQFTLVYPCIVAHHNILNKAN